MAILKNVIVNGHLYAGEILINDDGTQIPIRRYFLRGLSNDDGRPSKVVGTIVDDDENDRTTYGHHIPTAKAVKDYIDWILENNKLEDKYDSISSFIIDNISRPSGGGTETNLKFGDIDSDGYQTVQAESLAGFIHSRKSGWVTKDTRFFVGSSAGTSSQHNIVGKIKVSTTGSAVPNTTASSAATLNPGTEITITSGYYPSDRIIRASIADVGDESINAGTATFNSNDIDCITHTITYNSTSKKYELRSNAVGVSVTFSSAGWIEKSGRSGTIDFLCNNLEAGAISATPSVGSKSTLTPDVSINSAASYGFTKTQPSGTNGTNYLTINPGTSVSTYGKIKATPSVTTAGYIDSNTSTSASEATLTSDAFTIANGDNYYVPVITPTYTEGDLTASIKSSSTSATASGLTITDTDTDPGSGVYIVTGGTATANADHKATTVTNSAGVISAKDKVIVCKASNKDSSATSLTSNRYYVTDLEIPLPNDLEDEEEPGDGFGSIINHGYISEFTNEYSISRKIPAVIDEFLNEGKINSFTIDGHGSPDDWGHNTAVPASRIRSIGALTLRNIPIINSISGTGVVEEFDASLTIKNVSNGWIQVCDGNCDFSIYKASEIVLFQNATAGSIDSISIKNGVISEVTCSGLNGNKITTLNGAMIIDIFGATSDLMKGRVIYTKNDDFLLGASIPTAEMGYDGVYIANVKVTDDNYRLKTTSPTFSKSMSSANSNLADAQTNATLSSTNTLSGIAINATASGGGGTITYSNTAGWLAAHTNEAVTTVEDIEASTTKYLTDLIIGSGKTLNSIAFGGGTVTTIGCHGIGVVTNLTGPFKVVNNGVGESAGYITVENNSSNGTVNITNHSGEINITNASSSSVTTYKASGQSNSWTISQDADGNLTFTY